MNKKYKWNPSEETLINLNSKDYYVAFKSFRRSSTGYVNKKYVREFIFKKYNNKCCECGSNKELHIDHIKSVHFCFLNNLIYSCNVLDNLQLMCSKCNVKKSNKNE